jgi:hypothetical protein
MKKYFFTLALLGLSLITLRAQDTLKAKPDLSKAPNNSRSNSSIYTQEYYLKKSQRMNTTAWVFLGAGTACLIGGIIVYNDAMKSDDFGETIVNGVGGEAAIIVGSALMVTSIPLFIVAGSNKKKAMQMTGALRLVPYQELQATGMVNRNVPSISLKIKF